MTETTEKIIGDMSDVKVQTLGVDICPSCLGHKRLKVLANPEGPPTEVECSVCGGTGVPPQKS